MTTEQNARPDWKQAHPYDLLKDAGIPLDSHESDLYVLANPGSRAILARCGASFTAFRSERDGRIWLDIPFAYKPWWDAKAKSGQS